MSALYWVAFPLPLVHRDGCSGGRPEQGGPEIFNTDQGCQFTSAALTGLSSRSGRFGAARMARGGTGQNLCRATLAEREIQEVYIKAYSQAGSPDGHRQLPNIL